MRTTIILLIAITLLPISSCRKNANSHQFNKNELQISISTRSGWCAGGDSLTLGVRTTVYLHQKKCTDDFIPETLATNSSDWSELISLLDIDKFNNLNLDECGACYDGTDFTVTIKQRSFNHSIRFDKLNEPKLGELKPFADKLIEIRNQYKKQFVE